MFDHHPHLLRAWRVFCCLAAAAFLIYRGLDFDPKTYDDCFAPLMCFAASIVLMLTATAIFFRPVGAEEQPA